MKAEEEFLPTAVKAEEEEFISTDVKAEEEFIPTTVKAEEEEFIPTAVKAGVYPNSGEGRSLSQQR